MLETRRKGSLVGIVPLGLQLPGVWANQRFVRLNRDGLRRITLRNPNHTVARLAYAAAVLAAPQFLGYRPQRDARRVDFIREVGAEPHLLLIGVKFLDPSDDAWLGTCHFVARRSLVARLHAGTAWWVEP